jgi:hypothetical protein
MSKKRMQVILTEEAWAMVEAVTKEANDGFDTGTINSSDAINEMILTSKVDIKALQSKHTNIRRYLRLMAAKENMDIDEALRILADLKTKNGKKPRLQAKDAEHD